MYSGMMCQTRLDCNFRSTVHTLYLPSMLVGDAHLSALARASYTLQASV